jgi:hypothetical protein
MVNCVLDVSMGLLLVRDGLACSML